jgi:ABC-type transporter MlaC component
MSKQDEKEQLRKYREEVNKEVHEKWLEYKRVTEKILTNKENNLTESERKTLVSMFASTLLGYWAGDMKFQDKLIEELEVKYAGQKPRKR